MYTDNARPEVGVTQRQDSPIIGLKNFNNWVKSVIIAKFGHPALMHAGGGRGKVLDMGCGKGGDLTKWAKAKVRDLVGLGESICWFVAGFVDANWLVGAGSFDE